MKHSWMKGIYTYVLVALAVQVYIPTAQAQSIPRAAYKYQRDLIASARVAFGLNAPTALMAGQVHQESAWRPDARSPYAAGLTQFTPATARDIGRWYPDDLGDVDVYNPQWALLAMARYDKRLYDRFPTAATECDRWAFTLSSYNGGEGNVARDRRLCTARSCVSAQNPAAFSTPDAFGDFVRVDGIFPVLFFDFTQPRSIGVAESVSTLTFGEFRQLSDGRGRMFPAEEVILRSKSLVFSVVLTARQNLQILWKKIRSVVVDMMNMDSARKNRANYMGSYETMDISNVSTGTNVDSWIAVQQNDRSSFGDADLHQDPLVSTTEVASVQQGSSIAPCVSCDPNRWWGHVERHSGRAAWAFNENRGYPRAILRRWMPLYERVVTWGRGVNCAA